MSHLMRPYRNKEGKQGYNSYFIELRISEELSL